MPSPLGDYVTRMIILQKRSEDGVERAANNTEAEPHRRQHTVNSNTLAQVCRTSLRRQKGEHEAAVRTADNVTRKRVDPIRALATVQVRTNLRNHHTEEHESRPLLRWECAAQCRNVQHEPRYRNEATCGVNLPHE